MTPERDPLDREEVPPMPPGWMPATAEQVDALREDINRRVMPAILDTDRWTRHLLHISQHSRMTIGLAGRIQQVANEMRKAARLPEFDWNSSVPDAEFGECSVHVEDCRGQETHQ
jgi:hypothetical protein